MTGATAVLNSCAEARRHPRLDRENSSPRRIAVFCTDERGQAALEDARRTAGLSVSRIVPEDILAGPDALEEHPDLIVVSGAAGGSVDHLPALYDLAARLGVLLTAVLLSDKQQPTSGPSIKEMRRNTDMFLQTSDEDFLALMLHWLERPQ